MSAGAQNRQNNKKKKRNYKKRAIALESNLNSVPCLSLYLYFGLLGDISHLIKQYRNNLLELHYNILL